MTEKSSGKPPIKDLLVPQQEALLKMRKVLLPADGGSRFMVIMPTGTGKTMTIAMSPFLMDAKKVLIIVPDLTLKTQSFHNLQEMYNKEDHPLGKTGEINAKVMEFVQTVDVATYKNVDVVVTNVQALLDKSKGDDDDKAQLSDYAKRFLAVFRPDLTIVDEGHHFLASSWLAIAHGTVRANNHCKYLLFTATPQRGDGQVYGLIDERKPGHAFYFMYKRQQAIADKHIKYVTPVPIKAPRFTKQGPARYEEEDYIFQVVDPAVTKLLELRKACGNQPLRMLVTARRNDAATELAKVFNARSKTQGWKLHAEAVHGGAKNRDLILHNFSNPEATLRLGPDGNTQIVDVVIQVKLLGEGYDNPWIAVSAFVAPAKSAGTLSQIHGLAIRKPHQILSPTMFPGMSEQAMYSFLYYPDEVTKDGKKDVVEQYMNGGDESTANLQVWDLSLCSPSPESSLLKQTHRIVLSLPIPYSSRRFADKSEFSSLKQAHTKIVKLPTEEAVHELRTNFEEYHLLYQERRDGYTDEDGKVHKPWKPIPAERLAHVLYDKHLNSTLDITMRIVDFGCGPDGLFETALANKVEGRTGNGQVTVLALDVQKLSKADELTATGAQNDGIDDSSHTTFVCETLECDYTEEMLHDKFDHGIFCLSFMASDALSRGLHAAARAIKPTGKIHVVLDITKFGCGPYDNYDRIKEHLALWKGNFEDKTGFRVEHIECPKASPRMVYVTIENISGDQLDGLKEKLKGVTLQNLKVFVPPSAKKRKDSGDDGDEAVARKSLKRSLTESTDGGDGAPTELEMVEEDEDTHSEIES